MDKEIENFVKAVDDFLEKFYQATRIFVVNPNTLLKLNMNNFGTNIWFVSNAAMEENKCVEVVNDKLKRDLYRFCEKHPDRYFQGTRGD